MTEAPPSTAPPSTLDRTSTEASAATARRGPRLNPRAAITGLLSIAIIGLTIWYLARPEPLLVQGEAQSTPIDIAARVSGRLAKIPVVRGQDVAAGATLLVIDNPELIAELHEAEAEKMVADAELARINVGTRSEIIAQRKAEIDRAAADLTLARQTYNRTKQLAAAKFAPQSKLDQDMDALTLAQKRLDQANLASQEAVKGDAALSLRRVGAQDVDVERVQRPSELGHPVALDCSGAIDPKDAVLVAVERERLTVCLEILAGCLEVVEGRFRLDELQMHQAAGGVVDIDEQGGL